MAARVGLYREKKEGGKRKGYAKVNLGRGRRPGDLSGPFYLRYFCSERNRRVWEQVGHDLVTAIASRDHKENVLTARAAGVAVSEPGDDERLKIDDAIAEYLRSGKAVRKNWRPKTILAYTRSLALFRESYRGTYLDDVGRKQVLGFVKYLRTKKSKRGKHLGDRYIHNHLINLISFLNEYGKTGLIKSDEWPKYEEPKVRVYSDRDLTRLLEVCSTEERELVEFLLGSGCREGEVAHAEWIDIDFATAELHIYSKLEKYGWRVKDSEQRLVPLSDVVVEMLRRRRERHPNSVLIFPNSFNRPEGLLLRLVKSVALNAGLNCGDCQTTIDGDLVTCKNHPVCRRFQLHRFRKTWATRRSRAGMDIVTIAEKLGHSDLDTTRKYLKADDNSSERLRAQVNAADALLLQAAQRRQTAGTK